MFLFILFRTYILLHTYYIYSVILRNIISAISPYFNKMTKKIDLFGFFQKYFSLFLYIDSKYIMYVLHRFCYLLQNVLNKNHFLSFYFLLHFIGMMCFFLVSLVDYDDTDRDREVTHVPI